MTSDTTPFLAGPVQAGPTVLRPAPAGPGGPGAAGQLALLTWPALDAAGADAALTARCGGVSSGPYATLNLSLSVGDDPECVLENRRRLAACFGASLGDFVFVRQVHGAGVRVVGPADRGSGAFRPEDAIPDADALVTASPGVVLAILAADCTPVALHDPVAGVLACVHAGWRGTAARACAAAIAVMRDLGSRPSDVIAGIGPAVGAARYQVGPEVHEAVTGVFGPAASAFIRPDPSTAGRWLLDLWAANRHVLRQAGVPAPQIHTTTFPTGPVDHNIRDSRFSPASSASPASPASSASPVTPASVGYFFSDRSARPCGRLALIARLRKPMDAATQ